MIPDQTGRPRSAGGRQLATLLTFVLAAAALKVSAVSLENTISPNAIVIHHSGVSESTRDEGIRADDIAAWHRERGLTTFYWGRRYDTGFHYVVESAGAVVATRPEHCIGAHARGHNDAIGICVIGLFASSQGQRHEPRDAQPAALTDLTVQIMRHYHLDASRLLRHSDLNPQTDCPGDDFPWPAFIDRVQSGARTVDDGSADHLAKGDRLHDRLSKSERVQPRISKDHRHDALAIQDSAPPGLRPLNRVV
jgi:hypothetical protein